MIPENIYNKDLEEEVKQLFLDNNIKPPERLLTEIIYPAMTARDIFEIRLDTMLTHWCMKRNFIVDRDGKEQVDLKGQPKMMIRKPELCKQAEEIKERIFGIKFGCSRFWAVQE